MQSLGKRWLFERAFRHKKREMKVDGDGRQILSVAAIECDSLLYNRGMPLTHCAFYPDRIQQPGKVFILRLRSSE